MTRISTRIEGDRIRGQRRNDGKYFLNGGKMEMTGNENGGKIGSVFENYALLIKVKTTRF